MPTWIIVAVLFALVVGIDVWLWRSGGKTYSQTLRGWGRLWPPSRLIISLGIGVVLGHLYW